MVGRGDQRRMSIDGESSNPVPINSRPLVISDPSALEHAGQSFHFPRDVPNKMHTQQKLEEELKEAGEKIKHHEDNVKYLRAEKSKLKDSILDMQGSMRECYMSNVSKEENEDFSCSDSEEDTLQRILKYEKSAAAIFYSLKLKPEGADHPLMKDVVGVVATLGKVDDANLSRLLSQYLGLGTMLAVVCRTYEVVKTLEAYNEDGSINNGLGIHAVASSIGRPFADQFLVICLENLIPYPGELIADDPQQRLNLLEPRLINGQTPAGFLGFAVNMITIDSSNLYCASKTGHNLRETLFYSLFSNLQVYKSRDDMLKARPCLTHGAISLDGGIIRSPGVFSLGYQCEEIDLKFPHTIKGTNLPVTYFETENRLKEMKWKKDRVQEDMKREHSLLEHAKSMYEAKKQEYIQFLSQCSASAAQVPINTRSLVMPDPSALKHAGQSSSFPREGAPSEMSTQQAVSIIKISQKLEDELKEAGEKIKHYEDNVKYLRGRISTVDDSIHNMQGSMAECCITSVSKEGYGDFCPESEEDVIQRILKYEKSAAAIFYSIKMKLQYADHPLKKDVVGVVATLGKFDDANLNRLLSQYLGLDTMLAVVCRTYEGVKALETYNKDGSINNGLGMHSVAASIGRPLDGECLVICLENLRPYVGLLIPDDPQQRLNLIKPRLIDGDTPPGFLGFAVNMVTIDNTNLYGLSKFGRNLRETLFYTLFSNLQVYETREDMLKAGPYVTHGAISLDGGIMRSPGVYALGYQRKDVDLKFPLISKGHNLPVTFYEIQYKLKEMKRMKDRILHDLHREQSLLDQAKCKFAAKKQEFIQFLSQGSAYAAQLRMGHASSSK